MKLDRENKLLIGLCAMVGILIVKLFSIQIADHDYYQKKAEDNTKINSTIYPTRGIIHDRNGKILVGNRVAYDLMVTPSDVSQFDTLALAHILEVEPEFISIEDNLALIAVVGRGMVKSKGTAARLFKACAEADINIRMIDQGSSELNIIIGVDAADFARAQSAIYKEFVH